MLVLRYFAMLLFLESWEGTVVMTATLDEDVGAHIEYRVDVGLGRIT